MATYLITGGAGFIGSHIAEALVARGDAVRVFDNLSTGRAENLAHLAGVELVEADLRDGEALRRAARGVDVIFHQGALPSVARSLVDPIQTEQVNVLGTLNALIAAREERVRKLVFAGSSAVYGDGPGFPRREDMPARPLSPYAASKAAGEAFCISHASSFGLATVTLRYFNVFGPRQVADSPYSGVIGKFITAALIGQDPVIEGDGEQSRDFTYVDNVVHANLLAADRELPAGAVINVAMGGEISVKGLLQGIGERLGHPIEPRYRPARAGDVRRSIADIGKARALLGYRPLVSFSVGLERTIAWYAEELGAGSEPQERRAYA